jgi:hypothetical protein
MPFMLNYFGIWMFSVRTPSDLHRVWKEGMLNFLQSLTSRGGWWEIEIALLGFAKAKAVSVCIRALQGLCYSTYHVLDQENAAITVPETLPFILQV